MDLKLLNWKSDTDEKVGMLRLKVSLQNLLHNMVSVLAVIALANGSSKIEPKHLLGATDYLLRKCPWAATKESKAAQAAQAAHMNGGGGTFMPAAFFNPNAEPMYQSGNAYGGTTDTINFAMGTARDALNQSGGGSGGGSGAVAPEGLKKLVPWMKSMLQQSATSHKVTISKMANRQILDLSNHLWLCLLKDISKKTPVSAKRVETVLGKKMYSIFH